MKKIASFWRFQFIDLLIGAAVGLTIAGLCFWKISEYDCLWYVRLGREILDFRSIVPDHLSFSIEGSTWVPFHWLTYVGFALTEKYFGIGGLTAIRSLFIFLFIFGLSGIVQITSRGESRRYLAFLLPICIFLMCQWRVFLAGDFISAVEFTYLLLALLAPISVKKKLAASFALLVLWANCHGGTFPIGAAVVSMFILSEQTIRFRNKILLIAVTCCLWFVSPNGFGVVGGFLKNSFQYKDRLAVMHNPDWAPFTWSLLLFRYRAWSYVLWFAYSVLALASTIGFCLKKGLFKDVPRLAGPYRFSLIAFLFWLFLSTVTFQHVRGILFQSVFILPIVSVVMNHLIQRLLESSSRKLQILTRMVIGVAAVVLVLQIVPDNLIRFVGYERGVGIDSAYLPVHAVEFIERNHLQANVLNSIDIGGLMLYAAPDYKVAIDGRDIPFLSFLREWVEARRGLYQQFLDKYKIETVIEVVPAGFFPIDTRYYPSAAWAPVFLDNTAVIYMRRRPENTTFVQLNEFKSLNPAAVGNFISDDSLKELDRCIRDNEYNEFCGKMMSRHLSRTGRFVEAAEILNRLLRKTPYNSNLLAEAIAVDRKAGDETRARALESWASRLQ